ncbi:MAG: zf-HC2 domain-containing protein [Firmicutes bacterium]|jgi:hypothetical protein|nr:zf-HC2 domain-containing protein [Bacillota bacterium]
MDRCDIEAISAMIDGELPEADAALLRGHFDKCPSCRILYDDFASLKKGFADLDVEPPDTLAPGILYKINLGEEPSRIRRVVGRLAAVAACAVVLLFVTRMAEPSPQYDTAPGGDRIGALESAGARDAADAGGKPYSSSDAVNAAPDPASGGGTDETSLQRQSTEYRAFLAQLTEKGLEFSEEGGTGQLLVNQAISVWIGDAPYEKDEITLDGLTIELYIGADVSIDDILEEGRR